MPHGRVPGPSHAWSTPVALCCGPRDPAELLSLAKGICWVWRGSLEEARGRCAGSILQPHRVRVGDRPLIPWTSPGTAQACPTLSERLSRAVATATFFFLQTGVSP